MAKLAGCVVPFGTGQASSNVAYNFPDKCFEIMLAALYLNRSFVFENMKPYAGIFSLPRRRKREREREREKDREREREKERERERDREIDI